MTGAAMTLDGRLVQFNQLPSLSLHPSRYGDFLAGHAAAATRISSQWEAVWHRHWSRHILERLGLREQPVLDRGQPELALALLPPDLLAVCMRRMACLLCGPRLRRAIAGDEVRGLLAEIGAEALDFSRHNASAVPLDFDEHSALMQATAHGYDALGRSALLAALRGAGPALALRAELKLPAGPECELPLTPAQALELALAVLEKTDPSWHSSLPEAR